MIFEPHRTGQLVGQRCHHRIHGDRLAGLHTAVKRFHAGVRGVGIPLARLGFHQLCLCLRHRVGLRLLALRLLLLVQLEVLGVEALALAQFGKELGRVDLVHRVFGKAHHLQQELLLRIALHQGRRCANLNLEVALDALVVAVAHHPVEIPLDMGAGHVVIEALGKAAQNTGGVVVLHLHPAQRVRRVTPDTLQHGRHPRGVLGHLEAEVDDVHQLGLHAGHHKCGECRPHIRRIGVGIGPPHLAWAQAPLAIFWRDAVADDDLRRGRQAGVIHHRAGGAVQHSLHRANLATDADTPWHAWAALPSENVIGELAILHWALRRFHQPVVNQHRHGGHAVLVAVIQLHAHGAQMLPGAVAVEDPHFVLVVTGAIDSFRALAGARRAFAQCCQQLRAVVALISQHHLDLTLADVFPLPCVAAVVQVLATGCVGEEIPRVNAPGAWLDAVNTYQTGHLCDGVFLHQPLRSLDGEWPLEHARANARSIFNDLAHLSVPIAFDQRVFNRLLHLCGGLFCLRLAGLDLRLRLCRVGQPHGLRQHRELRCTQPWQWRRLDFPGPVIRWQKHVRHAGAGGVGVGPGDVEEHHGAAWAVVTWGVPGQRSLATAVKLIGVLIRPVGVINALVVLFVLSPLFLDAGAGTPSNGLGSLG